MKARIIRPDIEATEDAPTSKTVMREVFRSGRRQLRRYWKEGAVHEDPDVWKWVRMGIAVPADEECESAAPMTPAQKAAAQHAARRVSAGILPKDFQKFDRGLISGYNHDGTYRPGPQADLETIRRHERKYGPLPPEFRPEGLEPVEDMPDAAEADSADDDSATDTANDGEASGEAVDLDRPGVY